MPPLVIPNTAQVTLLWTLSGTPWAMNVLHYTIPSTMGVDTALAEGIFTQAKTDMSNAGLRPMLGSNWAFSGVSVRDLRGPNLPLFTSTGAALAGTAATETMPAQNCVCVTLRTALAGRSFRGRVYLSGFAEVANLGSGLIATAARDASANFINNIRQLIPATFADEIQLVVASRTLLETNAVQSAVVRDAVWDAQRRRRDGIVQT